MSGKNELLDEVDSVLHPKKKVRFKLFFICAFNTFFYMLTAISKNIYTTANIF